MAKAKVNKKIVAVGLELPECPVCLEHMSAPIFQCQSGHSLCNRCTTNLQPPLCPICRQQMTQTRNWQLEDLISKATVTCPNKPAGCVYTMVNVEVENHLKECIFREMACPVGAIFGKCFWSGKLKEMLEHFKDRHSENLVTETDIVINNVSITVDDRHMYMVAQSKFLFIVSFKIDTIKKMAYWAVQHIGSKKSANQHIYEIQVTSNQDNRRQAIFIDHCYNDAMDVNEVFHMAKCAVMPLDMVANFIKDKRLTFNCKIKRTQSGFKKGASSEAQNNTTNNQRKPPHPQGSGPTGYKGPGKNNFRGQSPGPHTHKGQNKQNKPHN